MASIWERIAREPIGMIALVATVGISLLENDWLWRQIDGELEIVAHHEASMTGQCSIRAMALDNRSRQTHRDVMIHIAEDWILRRGDEELRFGLRREMLIAPGEVTPLAYRDDVGVEYFVSGSTIRIPRVYPGQHIDLFFYRSFDFRLDAARRNLASDLRYWNTPRLGYAASDRGEVRIRSVGDCLERSP